MSTSSLPIAQRSSLLQQARDYVELTKPRISALVLVTVLAGAFVSSWGQPDPLLLIHTLLGTFLVAASASAMNHLVERRTDALMQRTGNRPLPTGRLSPGAVATFAAATLCGGTLYLALAVNGLAALLGAATWGIYVLVYTPLKSRTSWNTSVGAIAGALPVLIGASAGSAWLPALALAVILFLWQFPHFMAIAWIYRRQYAQAGLKMLPVVDPTGRRAGVQAVLTALALLPISFLPAWHYPGSAAAIYLSIALLLGAAQLACAVAFLLRLDTASARWLLRATLIYLPALMLLLVVMPLL